jgi:hypothetical protein
MIEARAPMCSQVDEFLEATLMTVRDDGVGYVTTAESERLRSLLLVLLVIAGLSLVAVGIVAPAI